LINVGFQNRNIISQKLRTSLGRSHTVLNFEIKRYTDAGKIQKGHFALVELACNEKINTRDNRSLNKV